MVDVSNKVLQNVSLKAFKHVRMDDVYRQIIDNTNKRMYLILLKLQV